MTFNPTAFKYNTSMNITLVSAHSPEPTAKYLAEKISSQLQESKTVLWLLSGGSAIAVAVAAAEHLKGQDLAGLTVSLIDERYGQPGHPDSNWRQLETAGFNLPGATLHPVLTGVDQPATATTYADFLKNQFSAVDFRLGLLGIGPDGHTSGILPHSPAVTAPGLVCAYDGPDYQRVTTTPAALACLDEAVIYATGPAKWSVLDRLETDAPVADQPAQALKSVSKLTIFTDRPEKSS